MVSKIIKKLFHEDLLRSMLLSVFCKPLGMLISVLYTPLLLTYLGTEKYGLWVTIFSIVNWINYFDIGIGNGLRNLLTEEIKDKDEKEAQKSISTAYIMIAVISGGVLLLGVVLMAAFDLNRLLNTALHIKPVIMISFCFMCINFVLSLCKILLFSIQKSEFTSIINIAVQLINLLGILILILYSHANLILVAILIGGSALFVNLVTSKILWNKYSYLKPHYSGFSKEKLNTICVVGIKFFMIQIAALVLYTTDNLIITHFFGAEEVTPYSTVYNAFNIIYSLLVAFMTPLWSKYTLAVKDKQYKWIENTVIKLDCLIIPISICLGTATFFWEDISYLWLGKTLAFPTGLIGSMAIYFILISWSQIYATVANGMGAINLQLVLSTLSAIMNIPLSIFLGKNLGMSSTGVLLATIICMAITAIPMTIYIHVLLRKKQQMTSLITNENY